MTAIRYRVHFAILIVAIIVFWFAKDLALGAQYFNFDFYSYGLMGAFHATAVVVSLRGWSPWRPVLALCFILLAIIWSAATPLMGLWGSVILFAPIKNILPRGDFSFILIYLVGSAVGCSGYWLLVRWFWLKSLRRTDWLRTMALCVAATLSSAVLLEVLNPRRDVGSLVLTEAWWFAFSISLYWSETSGYAKRSAAAMQTVQ
jgi:hypothetical protein